MCVCVRARYASTHVYIYTSMKISLSRLGPPAKKNGLARSMGRWWTSRARPKP